MPLPSGVYAEVNLSANHLRDQMKALLDTFGIERHALRIFLRQDRDAEGGDSNEPSVSVFERDC